MCVSYVLCIWCDLLYCDMFVLCVVLWFGVVYVLSCDVHIVTCELYMFRYTEFWYMLWCVYCMCCSVLHCNELRCNVMYCDVVCVAGVVMRCVSPDVIRAWWGLYVVMCVHWVGVQEGVYQRKGFPIAAGKSCSLKPLHHHSACRRPLSSGHSLLWRGWD